MGRFRKKRIMKLLIGTALLISLMSVTHIFQQTACQGQGQSQGHLLQLRDMICSVRSLWEETIQDGGGNSRAVALKQFTQRRSGTEENNGVAGPGQDSVVMTAKQQTAEAEQNASNAEAERKTSNAEAEEKTSNSEGGHQHVAAQRDPLAHASSLIKTSVAQHSYKFSNRSYFHPPEPAQPLNLPPLLHTPTQACSQEDGRGTFLVVLVMSSYLQNGTVEREAIRSTYGSVVRGGQWPHRSMAAPASLVFLLGRPPSRADRQRVDQEMREHDDIVMADFLDSYHNLTLKVLVGLSWALHHCPQANFILKTDDDTFVNLPLLTTFLLQRGRSDSIYGTRYKGGSVVRSGRWAVPRAAFPFPFYPPYMSGTGYVLSKSAAQKVVEASKKVPLIPIEDAYITGIMAEVGQIPRVSCSGFTYHKEGKPSLCDFVLDRRLVGNKLPAASKKDVWEYLRRGHCHARHRGMSSAARHSL